MKQEEGFHFGNGKGKFGRKKHFFLVLGRNRRRECKAVNVLVFIHLKTLSFLENEEKTVSLLPPLPLR